MNFRVIHSHAEENLEKSDESSLEDAENKNL